MGGIDIERPALRFAVLFNVVKVASLELSIISEYLEAR